MHQEHHHGMIQSSTVANCSDDAVGSNGLSNPTMTSTELLILLLVEHCTALSVGNTAAVHAMP